MGDSVAPIEPIFGTAPVSRVYSSVESPIALDGGGESDGAGHSPRAPAPGVPARLAVSSELVTTHAQFVYDEASRLVQVRIIDNATDRVVREIPPKALMELAASLRAYQEVGHASRLPRLLSSPAESDNDGPKAIRGDEDE